MNVVEYKNVVEYMNVVEYKNVLSIGLLTHNQDSMIYIMKKHWLEIGRLTTSIIKAYCVIFW